MTVTKFNRMIIKKPVVYDDICKLNLSISTGNGLKFSDTTFEAWKNKK